MGNNLEAPGPAPGLEVEGGAMWECGNCTFHNDQSEQICGMCRQERKEDSEDVADSEDGADSEDRKGDNIAEDHSSSEEGKKWKRNYEELEVYSLVTKEEQDEKLKSEANKYNQLEKKTKELQEEQDKMQEERDEMQEERDEMDEERYLMQVERNEMEEERFKMQEERFKMQQERDEMQKVLEEMRSKVECPVCLVVPRAGPVPVCPMGHFICSGCKERRGREGEQDCPSCRGPMGEAQSLLASVVIENVKHECENKDCDEMIQYKELKIHQETCKGRLVLCPGHATLCGKMVPFIGVANHIQTCPGFPREQEKRYFNNMEERSHHLPDQSLEDSKEVMWYTEVCLFDDQKFFFRIRKLRNVYSMEVVLLGTQQEAIKYYAEISIINPKAKSQAIKSCFEPRHISQDMWGSDCFTLTEDALAKLWTYDAKEKRHMFIVKVHIFMNKD